MSIFAQASCKEITLLSVFEIKGPSRRPSMSSLVGGGDHGLG